MLDVIFLSPHCDPQADLGEPDSGGQCIYEHELALALSGLPDIRVTVFCRQNFIRPDTSIVNNSYTIQRITCGLVEGPIPKEEIESVLHEFAQKVYSFVQEHLSMDSLIIHGHYWDGAFAALHLKNLSEHKLPFVWTPHSLGSTKHRKFSGEENEWQFHFWPRQVWEGYGTVVADTVILSSEEEKLSLTYDYAVREDKIHVIPPGINLPQFVQVPQMKARRALGLPLKGKILLSLGRMVKTKGYHHAIRTLAALQKLYGGMVYLAIFGGSGSKAGKDEAAYLQSLKDLAMELHVFDKVLFLPAVEHARVNEVFSAADIFLMTSEHEPFGLVTLEAMAMKIPVVAANSGGSLSIITHNQTGILVDYNQPERAAQYMLSLLKDKPLYVKIVEKAHRYARIEYDWYQKSSRFAQVYRQISRFNPIEEFHEHVKSTYFLQRHFER